MGRELRGTYHLPEDRIYVYTQGERGRRGENRTIAGLTSEAAREFLAPPAARSPRRSSWCAAPASASTSRRPGRPPDTGILRLRHQQLRRRGAAGGVHRLRAPAAAARGASAACCPRRRHSPASCSRSKANMDPAHRDRIAFLAAGAPAATARGMRLFHVRLDKEVRVADALTFMAADRAQARKPGRAISSACTTTARSTSATPSPRGSGSPSPVCRTSPRRSSAAPYSLTRCGQGAAEGPGAAVRGGCYAAVQAAAQQRDDSRRGRQFEVAAFRLQDEYGVQCVFEPVTVHTARWSRARMCSSSPSFAPAPMTTSRSDHTGALVHLAALASICS